jgi:Tol biopolymer transport system component
MAFDGSAPVFSQLDQAMKSGQIFATGFYRPTISSILKQLPANTLTLNSTEPKETVDFATGKQGFDRAYTLLKDGATMLKTTVGQFNRIIPNLLGTNSRPCFSPDDRRLVCVTEKDGKRTLTLMYPDGTSQVPLTTGNRQDADPVWAPGR